MRVRPPMTASKRHENIIAAQRSVLKRGVQWQVSRAGGYPFCRRRNQRAGDAEFGFIAEQTVRIARHECQADERRDRSQCDVSLVEIDAEAERFFALNFALTNHAAVRHRRGIRACPRIG